MWFPAPLLLPLSLRDENLRDSQSPQQMCFSAGMFQWQMVPLDPHTYQTLPFKNEFAVQSLKNEEAKKFMINRSVFDLMKVPLILELTDPKLLGWYLSLPPDDRRIIQGEGGLFHFLQKHPALGVTQQIVYLKNQFREECGPQEMSSNLNKSRRPSFYCVSQCQNCGICCPSDAKWCRRCNASISNPPGRLSYSEKENDQCLKEELNLCDLSGNMGILSGSEQPIAKQSEESFQSACDVSQVPLGQQGATSSQSLCQQPQLWQEQGQWGEDGMVTFGDLSAQASFSLDAELDARGKTSGRPQGGSPTRGEHGVLGAAGPFDFPDLERETLPEYCSFSSTGPECTAGERRGAGWFSELDFSGSDQVDAIPQPTGAENSSAALSWTEQGTSEDSNFCSPDSVNWTDNNGFVDPTGEEDSRSDPKGEEYHSVVEDGLVEPGAAWASPQNSMQLGGAIVSSKDLSTQANSMHLQGRATIAQSGGLGKEECGLVPCPLSERQAQSVDSGSPVSVTTSGSPVPSKSSPPSTLVDYRASFIETRQSTMRSSTCAEVQNSQQYTGLITDPPQHHRCVRDRDTQTQPVTTAEKYVNTDVYMMDLNCLTEELVRLRHSQTELTELKEKLASRSSEGAGDSCSSGRRCECAKRAVRAELRLLALQYGMCQQHCWRHFYTSPEGERHLLRTEGPPESVTSVLQELDEEYREMRRKVMSGVPLDELRPLSVDCRRVVSETRYTPAKIIGKFESGDCASGADKGAPQPTVHSDGRGGREGPHVCRSGEGLEVKKIKAAVVANVPLSSSTLGRAPGEHKPANEPKSPEAWYDAAEDLAPVTLDVREGPQTVVQEDKIQDQGVTCETVGGASFSLRVTDLPNDATEEEVMVWFGPYAASSVCVTVSNNIRTAIVTVSSRENAVMAVKELNGRIIQGHAVRVEPIPTSSAANESQGSKNSQSSTAVKRLEKLMNVQESPTAWGTCVPQHYAAMGSFDTLMGRLSLRHPEAGRRRIVNALLKLQAKHQGYLSGLPLKIIEEMTSDLLRQPPTVT